MSQPIALPNPIAERPSSLLQKLRSSAGNVIDRMANDNTVIKVREHKLTKAFMKVADKSGLKIAFKLAAAGTAGALGANVYGVALAGGAGVTLAEAIREYAQWRKEQENQSKGVWGAVKGFFSFVGLNKAKYAGKFLKNTGLGFLGAEIGAHLGDIKEFAMNIPGVSTLAEKAKHLADSLASGIIGVAHAQEMPANPVKAPIDGAAVLAAFDLSQIDTTGWDARALEDLQAAQAGRPWALQNLADYAANGRHGMKVDYDMARTLAEQAGLKGSRLSAGFLADLDRIAPRPSVSAPDLSDHAASSHPQAAPSAAPLPALDLAALDTTGWDARALADLQAAQAGRPWALQNMAYYAANGRHGVQVDFGMARKFAEMAQIKGDIHSARFLADLDALGRTSTFASAASHAPVFEAAAQSPLNPDSNVCFVSNDVGGIQDERLQRVDFTIRCENYDTQINPGADILVKDARTGGLLNTFRNSDGRIRSVRDMFQSIVNTLIYNQPNPTTAAQTIAAAGGATPAAYDLAAR